MPDHCKRGFLIFAHHDHDLANSETFLEECLDLARFDAMAAQFDPIAGASQGVDVASGRGAPGRQCGRWGDWSVILIHNMSYFPSYLAAI